MCLFAICNSHEIGVPLEHKQHNEKLTWEVVLHFEFLHPDSASSHTFMLILSKVEMADSICRRLMALVVSNIAILSVQMPINCYIDMCENRLCYPHHSFIPC
jgi:hypothetical protein